MWQALSTLAALYTALEACIFPWVEMHSPIGHRCIVPLSNPCRVNWQQWPFTNNNYAMCYYNLCSPITKPPPGPPFLSNLLLPPSPIPYFPSLWVFLIPSSLRNYCGVTVCRSRVFVMTTNMHDCMTMLWYNSDLLDHPGLHL
jgi:hypothetical protein